MRKNRNSFFTEANMNYTNFQNPGVMPQNIPYQAQVSGNFNYYQNQGMPYIDNTDNIENRLAKMERQINRLEHRVSKLENINTTFLDGDIDTTNNMYML